MRQMNDKDKLHVHILLNHLSSPGLLHPLPVYMYIDIASNKFRLI